MSLLRRTVVVSKQYAVQELAKRVSQEIYMADDIAEASDIVETVNPDLAVFDDRFNPSDLREFLNTTDKNSTHIPIVVVGNDDNDFNSPEDFLQIGPCEYLRGTKDYSRLEQIARRIRSNPKHDTTENGESAFFADDFAASVSMVGRSRAFVKTLAMIRLVAASRCNPVLIVGETGTGKELAAKAVHGARHPNGPFVAVNCVALTANLLESELFGHVKGSFTGADHEKLGLLELAGSGTILLDEISEMPLDLQAKLLRVLQEKTFRKVGGVKDITCNATIIASSNRNLYREMKANRFRRDLYYRLNICPVFIAPLRSPDRTDDIPLLADYFLNTSSICPEKRDKITCLTKLATESLQKHDWPGNVRELRNVIERAVLLETTDKIGLSSILINPTDSQDSPESHLAGQIKDLSLAKAERELIARALQETGWQKTRAAALLGITRATLYAKVKQYNIKKSPHSEQFARASQDVYGDGAEGPENPIPASFAHRSATAV
jgi:DNA-binding NtrC family response regulator